jgi:nucleoside-diphosphate-sugar epimerase
MATDMPTLVTGATGLIGGALARSLRESGEPVRALVRDLAVSEPMAQLGIELVEGDLSEPATLGPAVAGCAAVVHAAAAVSERLPRSVLWAANVDGTHHLARAALTAGVTRFVHVSSCAVYGSLQALGIDEDTPLRMGASDYHDSKVAAEHELWALAADGLPLVVARPSQVYGPSSENFTLRPLRALRHGRLYLIDGGRHYCKPVYLEDVTRGLRLCLEHPSAVGQAFNLTDDQPVTWRLFFGCYARMAGVGRLPSLPYPVAWLAAAGLELAGYLRRRPTSLTRRLVGSMRSSNSFSNRKARSLLGWQPRFDLGSGMQATEAWLHQQGFLPFT